MVISDHYFRVNSQVEGLSSIWEFILDFRVYSQFWDFILIFHINDNNNNGTVFVSRFLCIFIA